MLWHIELKFCIWLSFAVLQIRFECRQFLSIFVGVMPLLELRIMEIEFSAVFSYMIWHIELKFSIWLCFIVLHIKCECCQFLWELCPLWNLEYWKYSFPGFFFSYMLGHIELKFYIWLCFTVLQIKFECCHQLASIFVGVMPPLGLRILEIHSFPHFPPKCSDIYSWNFSYDFVQCTLDQVRVSSLCIRLALCPSFHFLRVPPTCIDKFSWNLKFDVGFLNAFLLEKYYIEIAF